MGHGERLPVRPGPASAASLFIFSFTETFLYFTAKNNNKKQNMEEKKKNQTIQCAVCGVTGGFWGSNQNGFLFLFWELLALIRALV